MVPLVILGVLIGLPTLLIFVLRSNGAIAFLALCAGTILLKYVGGNASIVLSSFMPHTSIVMQDALNLALLLFPATFITLFLRRSVSGAKAFLNLLPAAATGALVALSVVPLLSPITQSKITATRSWSILAGAQDLIVAAGVLLSLLLLWMGHRRSDKKDHSK